MEVRLHFCAHCWVQREVMKQAGCGFKKGEVRVQQPFEESDVASSFDFVCLAFVHESKTRRNAFSQHPRASSIHTKLAMPDRWKRRMDGAFGRI
jgi:hypothetical protein